MALDNEPSPSVRSFRDLIAWQKAIALAVQTYEVTSEFPKDETFGLRSQMRRAAVSVASNVAEGHERRSSGEFMQFLGHAKGSLAELETQAIIAGQLDLLSPAAVDDVTAAIAEVSRLLNGLLKAIRRRTAE